MKRFHRIPFYNRSRKKKTNRSLRYGVRVTGIALSLVLICLPVLSACSAIPVQKEKGKTDSTETAGQELTPSSLLEEMTLEQKIEQMLMPSIRDEDGAGHHLTELTPTAQSAIEQHAFCGYLFFSQNGPSIQQVTELTASMQRAAVDKESGFQVPLFLSVDQEGGRIERMGSGTLTPGNMALGATWDASKCRETAEIIGSEMKSAGFNLDYAPVMDINSNPANPVINLRSFGGDAKAVADMGSAFIKGLDQSGVIATMKHFPGHGDTATDSHTGLPLIDKSLSELQKQELIPFQAGIRAGADMIMTAHIEFPQIEKDTYTSKRSGQKIVLPATLSDDILTGVLREKMGYDGVIITDAIKMEAIRDHFDLVDAAELAINAGVDIILNPGDITTEAHVTALENYVQQIAARVEAGSIQQKTIDRAVLRILTLKERHGMLQEIRTWQKMTDEDVRQRLSEAEKNIGSDAHEKTIRQITSKTITLLENRDGTLPLSAGNTVILCPDQATVASVNTAVKRLKKEGVWKTDEAITAVSYGGLNAGYAARYVAGMKNVIGISVSQSLSSAGKGTAAAFLKAATAAVHKNGGSFTLISACLPYDVAAYQDADAILVTYGYKSITEIPQDKADEAPDYGPNLPAAIEAVFGGYTPSGCLPLEIPKTGAAASSENQILYPSGYGLRGWSEKCIRSKVSHSDASSGQTGKKQKTDKNSGTQK